MRTLRILPLLILASGAILAATLPTAGSLFEEHVVRKGQTASYIAFQKYGAFNDSIVGVLKADNPSLANLDDIKVGQVIRIRKAAEVPQVSAKRNPQRTIQLASQRAVVTLVKGTGTIRRANGTTETLAPNRFLGKGDAISTGSDGYAEIIIDNQSVLRLHKDTEIRLSSIQEPRSASSKDQRPFVTRLALVRGKTWTHVQKWAGGIVNYQIQLPTAIAGVHGTVFETEVLPDSTGSVAVVEGEVGVGAGATDSVPAKKSLAPKPAAGPQEIALDQWIRLVRTGMKLSVPKSGAPGEAQPWKPNGTEWKALEDARECLCD
jgi:hypothetical protein